MKFLIDRIRLKLLLEEKRDYINHPIEGIDMIVSSIIYMISLVCSDFKSIFGINKYVIQTIAWIIAIVIFVYGIVRFYRSYRLKYNHKMLFRDIENLNEVIHAFSLVAIKDTFNEFSNRFLLYYDKVWECWFFFNFKTEENGNEVFIKQKLSNMLKLDSSKINLKYISDRIQPKYSERDKIQKVYQHSLYKGEISKFPEPLTKNEFEIDNILYKWYTIDELESDNEIMKKNSDVIAYVKEKII